MKTLYDYRTIFRIVVNKGKEVNGERFQIDNIDRPTVLKLLCWFLQDEDAAPDLGIDLNKGILLAGPIGCGKSEIMKIMYGFNDSRSRFVMKPCTQVELEFATKGYDVIQKYTRQSFCPYSKQPYAICFDDLGIESNINYYGSDYNIMLKILSLRYDLFLDHQMITHVTTNLNSAEIETRYGNRVRSRMRQMFNLIAFPPNSRDKRM